VYATGIEHPPFTQLRGHQHQLMHHAVRIKLQIIIYIIYTLTKIYINYKKKN
jgi:hypothetical protein